MESVRTNCQQMAGHVRTLEDNGRSRIFDTENIPIIVLVVELLMEKYIRTDHRTATRQVAGKTFVPAASKRFFVCSTKFVSVQRPTLSAV